MRTARVAPTRRALLRAFLMVDSTILNLSAHIHTGRYSDPGRASGGSSGRFDLLYYDPLGRQDEEIRITVDPNGGNVGGSGAGNGGDDDDMTSPVELCVRTKWRDASVDWNGHSGVY
jgi:hypothetical protein